MPDTQLSKILERYPRGEQDQLIPLLEAAQDELTYLSPATIRQIARYLRVSPSEAFGVASFYAQFRFNQPGKHNIKVCLGTACHVRRSDLVMDSMERELGIHDGETTTDGQFSLQRVACLGCCALAPVVVVDQDVHSRMRSTHVRKLLKKYGG